jgi:hypothetical protein
MALHKKYARQTVSEPGAVATGSRLIKTPVFSMKSSPNPTQSLPLPVLISLRALIYLLFVQTDSELQGAVSSRKLTLVT